METRTKEFVWSAKLSKDNKVAKWPGGQESILEQIILKLAVLGPGAIKGERNLVQVTTFDSDQNKINACICSLTVGVKENQQLADLSLFPPANLTLIEGSGPVHIVGNHVILDEDELSDEEDVSEFEEEETIQDLREKLKAKAKGGKGDAPQKNKKEAEGDDDDEEVDEDEEDAKPANKGKNDLIELEADEDDEDYDDDDDMEDDSEEDDEDVEEVVEQTPSKKRKLTNGKASAQQQQNKSAEKKMTSPERGSKNVPEQKTPKQSKDAQKTPKSEKKTPGKAKPSSVEEVKALIKKYPGGKPRKEDKFCNWITSQFKVTDDAWKGELWKWHKKELGM